MDINSLVLYVIVVDLLLGNSENTSTWIWRRDIIIIYYY